MTEYIDQLVDKDDTFIYPKTLVSAIKDAREKLLISGIDQKNIRGLKDFSDGLQVNGFNVLTEQSCVLKKCSDVYDVKTSGLYVYDQETRNVPYMHQGEFQNGYFISLFKDENNGCVVFLGSLMYVEKFNGAWHRSFSPVPVPLWVGAAKAGDTLKLADDLSNYSSLRVYVNIPTMDHHVKECRLDEEMMYITYNALAPDGKELHIDEMALKKIDNRTLSFVSETLLAVHAGTSQKVTDHSLVKIEGISLP